MSYKIRMCILTAASLGLSSCEQRDDQALIKVYEVFQRDMQKRDEAAKASMEQIQGEIKDVKDTLAELQKVLPTLSAGGGGGGAEAAEKMAATVADVVGKKLGEQNAASLSDVKAQIALLHNVVATQAASQPAPVAVAPAPAAPAPAPVARAPAPAPNADGLRYRTQPPAALPPPPSTTKSSDPSRKKIQIQF